MFDLTFNDRDLFPPASICHDACSIGYIDSLKLTAAAASNTVAAATAYPAPIRSKQEFAVMGAVAISSQLHSNSNHSEQKVVNYTSAHT